jgi:hypothetical protein
MTATTAKVSFESHVSTINLARKHAEEQAREYLRKGHTPEEAESEFWCWFDEEVRCLRRDGWHEPLRGR